MCFCIALTAYSAGQLPKHATPPATAAEQPANLDPLGRETPRSSFLALLKYSGRDDFETAARFLQPVPGQQNDLVQVAREMQALHSKFKGNIAALSDDPNGTVESGLPPGEVRAGVVTMDATSADVLLVQVEDPTAGKIWLVSEQTVAKVPELYARLQTEAPTATQQVIPAALSRRHLLRMSLAQWLGWLLSIPLSWLAAWLVTYVLSMPRRIWYKLRRIPFRTIWQTPLGMPLKCLLAILLHTLAVYLMGPPLLYRVYYFRLMQGAFVGCLAWLLSRAADQGFRRAVDRTPPERGGGRSILILTQRLTHVVMATIAVVAALALLGVNMKTTLAGLGIGGLAIALAAQRTLENLIGGVSLLMDKAVSVGDFCKIGEHLGTVEDIGLRSLKLRTLDQNLLVVPNGALAQMQFENMRARSKLLINQHFSLRIETPVEQLRLVLDRLKKMLDDNPAIESGSSRLRITSFAGAAFDVELFAYGKTGNMGELTVIRQELILNILEIIEDGGAQLAAPTQLLYVSGDSGSDADTVSEAVGRVTELRLANDRRTRTE